MRLEVEPLEDFIRIWNYLVTLVRPDDGLEIFIESDGRRPVPHRLEPVDQSDDVLAPVRSVELVRGAVHQDVRERLRV